MVTNNVSNLVTVVLSIADRCSSAPFQSRPVLDMYGTEINSSSSPQFGASIATRRPNVSESPTSVLPMPRTSASPLLSRDDLEWWTNHLSGDDAPVPRRSPQGRTSPNTFNTGLLSDENFLIPEPSRRPTSTFRLSIEDDSSDEEFSSTVQRRLGRIRQTLRSPATQADWTHGGASRARERATRIIAERRAAAASARAPTIPPRPTSGASFGLPTIETSDFELPSEFGKPLLNNVINTINGLLQRIEAQIASQLDHRRYFPTPQGI